VYEQLNPSFYVASVIIILRDAT